MTKARLAGMVSGMEEARNDTDEKYEVAMCLRRKTPSTPWTDELVVTWGALKAKDFKEAKKEAPSKAVELARQLAGTAGGVWSDYHYEVVAQAADLRAKYSTWAQASVAYEVLCGLHNRGFSDFAYRSLLVNGVELNAQQRMDIFRLTSSGDGAPTEPTRETWEKLGIDIPEREG